MAEPTKILVIDDEVAIRRFLRASLDPKHYDLLEAGDGASGMRTAASENPSVLLLDLGLPDMDGIDVVRKLREWSQVPVIVLSARGQERDKVAALDAGADDYLTKPFGIGELMARIRVAVRHARPESEKSEPVFEAKNLRVDILHRRVYSFDQEVHLTPTEYKLLLHLIRHAGKVLTHRQLLNEVWGPA
ncbi:MAG TPA: response regulator, partial [Fimbriimonadaceae bacterium]|nr:response regulator [Fimbriimonadaceae bacterium]